MRYSLASELLRVPKKTHRSCEAFLHLLAV